MNFKILFCSTLFKINSLLVVCARWHSLRTGKSFTAPLKTGQSKFGREPKDLSANNLHNRAGGINYFLIATLIPFCLSRPLLFSVTSVSFSQNGETIIAECVGRTYFWPLFKWVPIAAAGRNSINCYYYFLFFLHFLAARTILPFSGQSNTLLVVWCRVWSKRPV